MTSENQAPKRKLIEVALPLEVINRESAREKSIRHGHPSTLHQWWSRKPTAAARAVLFAQLVDDPSARPTEFPTEELQREERDRLHGLIARLMVWENIRDKRLLAEAHAEIVKSTNDNPPAILDPFAGGGTIPLEAQRLGLEAHASDLNPVAVLISKALIEIPPKFRDNPPTFPGLAESEIRDWKGAEGLAADVLAYGSWMRDEAEKRIGHMYPKATLEDGSTAGVIAWIWARTVTCPNPACGIDMPLVRSWWLNKKKGREAYVVPTIVEDVSAPGGRRVSFEIDTNPLTGPMPSNDGTVARTAATCVACESSVPLKYIRGEGREGRLRTELIGVVAQGQRQRVYLAPTDLQSHAANIERPDSAPVGSLPPHGLSPDSHQTLRIYGFHEWADLFTARQLTALITFSDLINDARERVLTDALAAGVPLGDRLEAGGTHAAAYADAVATYLGFVQSKMTNLSSSITTWMSDRGALRESFARQALPMSWGFAETNVLSDSGGGWSTFLDKECKAIEYVPMGCGEACQADAATRNLAGYVISTDPPFRKLSVCYGSVCCCGTSPQRTGLAPLLRQAA